MTPTTSFRNSYTYTGRELDKEAGLLYYRARYRDLLDGSFLSKDKLGFAAGDVNLWNYVKGNPVNGIDPSGLAYFARRPLDGWPWIPVLSQNPFFDVLNIELSHEQLFFEDGDLPSSVGFFENGKLKYNESAAGYRMENDRYDDSIMRKAYLKVILEKYHLVFPLEGKNNCQNWVDDVKQEYNRLRNHSKLK